ncbi:uncharacterized protein [Halyomorpha halys]|uniref:uncharacterized protein n=1 Tax=Halyomorpha halys TaxID=286706 RepID=UPI0034D2A096
MNEPSGPTFVGARGQSWIDVTLATAPIAKRIADWTLRSDTSSDHRVIAFSVVEEEGGAPEIEKGFVTRSVNWRAFSSELEGILADREWEEMTSIDKEPEIDRRVAMLTGAITEAASNTLQRRRARVRPVTWWTPVLTQLKKEYYRARRRYQECRNDERRPELRKESKHSYRVYRNGVRCQKKKSWDQFIVEES